LLTAAERRFYHEGLLPAVGCRYVISMKVRLADVVTCPAALWERAPGRKIQSKHLDFVLLSPGTLRIVAAIELNDATHDTADRERRDRFVAHALLSARVPLVCFPIYRRYDPRKIAGRIQRAIRDRRESDHRPSPRRYPAPRPATPEEGDAH
jgi:hypothetical protein